MSGSGASGWSSSRDDQFLDDLLEGPRELAAVLQAQRAAIRDIPLGALSRPTWRFVGLGSSRFAALEAAERLRAGGRDAVSEVASASLHSPGGRDTLLVAISASGRTPEVLNAVERHRGVSFVLGLTAHADSPLARLSDAVVPLSAAVLESGGVASLTYRATVAALTALVAEGELDDVRDALAQAVPALSELIDGRDAWVGPAADVLDGARYVHILGDASHFGACEQASLMFREGPRIPAQAFDTGDWLHIGLYTVLPGDPVMLYTGADGDPDALRTIRARGGHAVVIGRPAVGGSTPDEGEVWIPLPQAAVESRLVRSVVESAVAELIAAELWQRAGATVVGEDSPRR